MSHIGGPHRPGPISPRPHRRPRLYQPLDSFSRRIRRSAQGDSSHIERFRPVRHVIKRYCAGMGKICFHLVACWSVAPSGYVNTDTKKCPSPITKCRSTPGEALGLSYTLRLSYAARRPPLFNPISPNKESLNQGPQCSLRVLVPQKNLGPLPSRREVAPV